MLIYNDTDIIQAEIREKIRNCEQNVTLSPFYQATHPIVMILDAAIRTAMNTELEEILLIFDNFVVCQDALPGMMSKYLPRLELKITPDTIYIKCPYTGTGITIIKWDPDMLIRRRFYKIWTHAKIPDGVFNEIIYTLSNHVCRVEYAQL